MFDRSTLLAAIPGLVHGFTDREGGVSTGRYASLNMASKWGDDVVAVAENRRRLGVAAGFDPARLRLVRQVHGAAVAGPENTSPDAEADALVTTVRARETVGVLTADCVPVLIADRDGTAAAAVHSGWRGTLAGVVPAAVRVLLARGIKPADLVVAIGPCIEQPAFEVGPEVAAAFEPRFVDTRSTRPHIDLVAAVRDQLVALGVPAETIERVGGCTHAHPHRWFSYRRDGACIGQMLAFIGWA